MRKKSCYVIVFLGILCSYFSFARSADRGEIRSGETKTGFLSSPGFADSWNFYGGEGDRVIITAAEISGYVEPEIYLYPPDSGELEASAIGPNSGKRLDHQLQRTGLYTIVISDYYLDEEGDYGIALVKIPGAATSPTDPDGGLIASGDGKTGILTHQADTDIYQFYGKVGDHTVITAAEISGYVEPEIYLYPPDSGELEASATGPNSGKRLDHTLEKTGLYTILISDYYLDEEGEYGMSLTKIPPTLPPGIYNAYPSNGSAICNMNGSFSWDPVQEATGYDLYFGEDVIEPLEKVGDNLPSPRLPFPEMEPGRAYYWHVVAHTSDGDVQGPYLWFYVPENCVVINRVNPWRCEPRTIIRIIGENFGDTQGDSLVHIGRKTFDSSSPRIKLWTDTKIKVRVPKYKCKWFKGEDSRKVKVWVTVDGIDSNTKRLKVLKPAICP